MTFSSLKKLSALVAAVSLLSTLAGCAAKSQQVDSDQSLSKPRREFPPMDPAKMDSRSMIAIYDPLEPVNRSVYNFNARFDRYVFLPVVAGYKAVMPDVAETGVTNFFSNLSELKYFVNNVLQGEWRDSGVTAERFAINTTVGVLGLWDPATRWGIYKREEDFGQTLGRWGVTRGPYIVLPFFGPSSLRDTGGLAFDSAVKTGVDVLDVNDDANKDGIRLGLSALESVDIRKNTRFRYYETGTPFEYSLVRYTYLRMREVQVEK
jgi:phospholipid-binding lipoprotein MlaA